MAMANDPLSPRAFGGEQPVGRGSPPTDARSVPQAQVTRDPGVRAQPEDFGAQIGAVRTGIADVFGKVAGDILRRRQHAEDEAFANAFAARARVMGAQRYGELSKTAVDGPDGFYSVLNADLTEKYEGALEALRQEGYRPSMAGVAAARKQAEHFKGLYGANAVVYENNVRALRFVGQTKQAFDTMDVAVQNDPDSFLAVAADKRRMLEGIGPNLPADDRVKLEEPIYRNTAEAAIRGRIIKDPARAVRELDGGLYDQWITSDQKAVFKTQAQNTVFAHANERAAAFADSLVATGGLAEAVRRVQKNDLPDDIKALPPEMQAKIKHSILSNVSQQLAVENSLRAQQKVGDDERLRQDKLVFYNPTTSPQDRNEALKRVAANPEFNADQFDNLIKYAAEGTTFGLVSDPGVLFNLRVGVQRGEVGMEDVAAARRSLTRQDFESLVALSGAQSNSALGRVLDYVEQDLGYNKLVPPSNPEQMLLSGEVADVKARLQRFALENPKMTQAQLLAEADGILGGARQRVYNRVADSARKDIEAQGAKFKWFNKADPQGSLTKAVAEGRVKITDSAVIDLQTGMDRWIKAEEKSGRTKAK